MNRLSGTREAVVHEQAGVTRDRKEIEADWNGVGFTLVDTGGVDFAGEHEMAEEIRRQALSRSRKRTSRCSWSTPAPGLRPGDAELARELRGGEVPVIVAANKVDDARQSGLAGEFYGLGLGDPLPSRPPRASAPATCWTASSSGCRRSWRSARRSRGSR